MKNLIHIILVDDHPMVLTGLSAILQSLPNMNIVGQFLSAKEAQQFLEKNIIDLLITDINLPDKNGIILCKEVQSQYPDVKIIAMSTFEDRNYIASMIESGALGYISKSTSPDDLLDVIHKVMLGELCIKLSGSHFHPNILNKKPVLTRREEEVLQCIAEGLTNKEIAEKLIVSQHTIDSHRKNLLMKFEAQNTAALIASAAKLGLV